MIEELKVLLDMLSKVPNAALWAVFAVFLYKLTVYLATTGSLFLIVKLAIERLHSYKTDALNPKPPPPPPEQTWNIENTCITSSGDVVPRLRAMLENLAMSGGSKYAYLHQSHIDWLSDAIAHWHAKAGAPKPDYKYQPQGEGDE